VSLAQVAAPIIFLLVANTKDVLAAMIAINVPHSAPPSAEETPGLPTTTTAAAPLFPPHTLTASAQKPEIVTDLVPLTAVMALKEKPEKKPTAQQTQPI